MQRVWVTPGDGEILPIPGTGDLASGRSLVGDGQELVLGEGGVEDEYNNPQQGGGGATVVCLLFLICVTGGVAIRLGYLGGHPLYGKVPMGYSRTRW